MPALRFYACEGCATVYAGLDEPAVCSECGDRLRDIAATSGEGTYFWPTE